MWQVRDRAPPIQPPETVDMEVRVATLTARDVIWGR